MRIRNLLLLLLCIAATVLSAQVVIRGGDSLTGTVSSARGGRIGILDDRVVFDASNATVVTHLGTARVSDIKKGDRVHATIAESVGGELSASSVLILDEHDATLSGGAEQIDVAGGSVTLLDRKVGVTPSTVLRGLQGEPLPGLGSIVRGQHLTVALDGAQAGLVAKSITISSAAPFYPTELYGTIDSISDDLWTIVAPNARITVRVTPETTVVGTPRVGDQVFVTFRTGSDGLKVAISIGPGVAPDALTFNGTITRMGADEWQVDARTVVLNGETRVGKSLQLGDRVAVTAMSMSGSKVLALEIARQPRHRVVNH